MLYAFDDDDLSKLRRLLGEYDRGLFKQTAQVQTFSPQAIELYIGRLLDDLDAAVYETDLTDLDASGSMGVGSALLKQWNISLNDDFDDEPASLEPIVTDEADDVADYKVTVYNLFTYKIPKGTFVIVGREPFSGLYVVLSSKPTAIAKTTSVLSKRDGTTPGSGTATLYALDNLGSITSLDISVDIYNYGTWEIPSDSFVPLIQDSREDYIALTVAPLGCGLSVDDDGKQIVDVESLAGAGLEKIDGTCDTLAVKAGSCIVVDTDGVSVKVDAAGPITCGVDGLTIDLDDPSIYTAGSCIDISGHEISVLVGDGITCSEAGLTAVADCGIQVSSEGIGIKRSDLYGFSSGLEDDETCGFKVKVGAGLLLGGSGVQVDLAPVDGPLFSSITSINQGINKLIYHVVLYQFKKNSAGVFIGFDVVSENDVEILCPLCVNNIYPAGFGKVSYGGSAGINKISPKYVLGSGTYVMQGSAGFSLHQPGRTSFAGGGTYVMKGSAGIDLVPYVPTFCVGGLFGDDFTGGTTDLHSHDAAWNVYDDAPTATLTVTGGVLVQVGAAVFNNTALVDAGTGDVDISVDVNFPSSSYNFALMLRCTNSVTAGVPSHFMYYYLSKSSGGTLNGGIFEDAATGTHIAPSISAGVHTVRAVANGSYCALYLGGTLLQSITSSHGSTNTFHGINTYTENVSFFGYCTFDNFCVSVPSPCLGATLADAFDRTGSIDTSTPDVSPSTTWVVTDGSFTLDGDWAVDTTVNASYALCETYITDFTMQFTVRTPTTITVAAQVFAIFRCVTSANVSDMIQGCWFFVWDFNDSSCNLKKFVSGTGTYVGTPGSFSASTNTEYQIKIVCSGDDIYAYIDNTLVTSVNDSDNNTNTVHGFGAYSPFLNPPLTAINDFCLA